MKNHNWTAVAILSAALSWSALPAQAAPAPSVGEQGYMKHCAVCHPNGGNIITPNATLGKKAMAAKGIRTPADIVGKMRKPGPAMMPFDAKTVPDKEALEISEYILDTFK